VEDLVGKGHSEEDALRRLNELKDALGKNSSLSKLQDELKKLAKGEEND
jgi:hypothetical protein